MKEGYRYAFLREEGAGSSCLALEHVMTGAGPVVIGALYDGPDGENIVQNVIGWFYEDALPVIREHGLGASVRNTFLQKDRFRDERLKVVVMFRKRVFLYGTDGILKVNKRGYLLITKDFSKAVPKEEFCRFFEKNGIGEADVRLKELGRRAKLRNRTGRYDAVYLESTAEYLFGRVHKLQEGFGGRPGL